MVIVFFVFFFQAEDGIRDLLRSRGLGDVYKRQVPGISANPVKHGFDAFGRQMSGKALVASHRCFGPVSYTHLTLPTSDLV